jgi:glucose-6-phosphate 1-dehydrogenase
VRITFKPSANAAALGAAAGAPNELVMRIQPNEAIYMKVRGKRGEAVSASLTICMHEGEGEAVSASWKVRSEW